ncbi:MAG: GDSL-like Lipase/Acylhydrolase [candidate division BRC1 bacterium ADurb.BinA364]|nr:MAG: GDSL-like Lipase/Acylhydrolase [candidate division BRC1 bacterium ADurb.BinA364]
MNRALLFSPVLSLLFAHAEGAAAERPTRARQPNPAFASIEDEPGLPRVLLLGDSISIAYTIPTRELLQGKANVHRPADNCGFTAKGLENLDKWLGDKPWDVIHFNWGLHDLKFLDAQGKLASPESGTKVASLEQYRANLEQIVERLEKTGAKLIWASTTPVPEGAEGRIPGDEANYNAVAKEVMDAHGVAIDDLWAFASPRLKEIQREANVHFTEEGSQALAEQVAGSILRVLGNSAQ